MSEHFISLEDYLNNDTHIEDYCIRTGWVEFDKITEGFFSSELTIIGGKSGIGKTWFMLRLIINILNREPEVLYLNLQETRFSILNIIDKIEKYLYHIKPTFFPKRKNLKIFKERYFYIENLNDILDVSINETKETILFIDSLSNIKSSKICTDYFKENVDCSSIREFYIMDILKELAIKYNIPIVVNVDFFRIEDGDWDTNIPELSDIRVSYEIEDGIDMKADRVILLHTTRDKYDNSESQVSFSGIYKAFIIKNKFSNCGVFSFRKSYLESFCDLTWMLNKKDDLNKTISKQDDLPF